MRNRKQARRDRWSGILETVRGVLSRAAERRRTVLQLQELEALDDHILQDIGLTRDEVEAAGREARTPCRIDWTAGPCRE